MKLALVTAPTASTVGRALSALGPALARRCELALFRGASEAEGLPLTGFEPRAFDHLLVVVADDPACSGAWPLVRRFGGTVALLDWSLERAAAAARPALAAHGGRQTWSVLQEGGWADVERLARRRRGEGGEPLVANRGIVRHADSFLVGDEDLVRRIRADRNEPTPVALVPIALEREPERVAEAWIAALQRFPPHRSGRRSVARNLFGALRRAEPRES